MTDIYWSDIQAAIDEYSDYTASETENIYTQED